MAIVMQKQVTKQQRSSVWVFALAAMLTASVNAVDSEWKLRFERAWESAQAAEAAGRWEEAERLYGEVQSLIPGESVSLVSRARCLGHLDRDAEALDCLKRAVESGWNQSDALREEAAFDDLREHAGFKKLFNRIEEIERQPILVYVPPSVDTTKPTPLIIAFHGRGENPHYFLPSWHKAADALGVVVVAPRGVHRAGNKLLNMWEAPEHRRNGAEIDLEACQAITGAAIKEARKHCTIDERRIMLAGYSQGGAVALRLLGEQPDRYLGAFAQATLYKDMGVEYWEAVRAKKAGRVVLFVGTLDNLRPHSERALEELESAGWTVQFTLIPNVGHEGPADNVPWQIAAIGFLMEGQVKHE